MTTNPWDIPPFPEKGSDEEALYASIGRALSQWENFEIGCASLFAFLVGARSRTNTPAARAYGSVLTFRGRIEMVQAAAEVYFANHRMPVLQRRCKELTRDATNFSPRRNEIAHGMVLHYGIVVKRGAPPGYVLAASWYASNKRTLKAKVGLVPWIGDSKFAYSISEIDAFRREFTKLAERAIKLGNDVRDKVARPEADYIPK